MDGTQVFHGAGVIDMLDVVRPHNDPLKADH